MDGGCLRCGGTPGTLPLSGAISLRYLRYWDGVFLHFRKAVSSQMAMKLSAYGGRIFFPRAV